MMPSVYENCGHHQRIQDGRWNEDEPDTGKEADRHARHDHVEGRECDQAEHIGWRQISASFAQHAAEFRSIGGTNSQRHCLDDLPREPLFISCDPTRMAQVICNLVSNAAKYTPPGGSITVGARRRANGNGADGTVEISVRDTGIGIPRDMLGKVFDMFTQVAQSLDRSQGGLGIGLSLAKRLVELHGGSIHAVSAGDNRGSTFIVELPLAAPSEADGGAPGRGAGGARAGPGRRRILVVDDNVDAAESLQTLLALAGHEAHLAHTGAEALAAVDRYQPSLVFLDIGLPDLNGHEVARAIRSRPHGAGIVLAALTGWGSARDQQLARQAGVDLHLTKPVSAEDLDRALQLDPATRTG